MARVLVTGTGGPAGVAVVRALLRRGGHDVWAADMDGWAAGLYLVPPGRRRIVPPGADPGFVDAVGALCRADGIEVLVPTVDVELPALAAHRADLLRTAGTALAAPSAETIELALDKLSLARACAPLLRVPTTTSLGPQSDAAGWTFPVIVKPRRGSGSRGVRTVPDADALRALGADDALIVQELLPGAEYSVDVLADASGHVVAAVPRTRARVDSGVSIAGTTVHDDGLETIAAAVARAIGLVGVANVQVRRDREGGPALLEVNPRFPGALPLTVAAGVDMPSLAVDLALGREIPEHVGFRELATVRFLEDVFLDPGEVLTSAHAAHQEGSS